MIYIFFIFEHIPFNYHTGMKYFTAQSVQATLQICPIKSIDDCIELPQGHLTAG
jgi:hypothetical protein